MHRLRLPFLLHQICNRDMRRDSQPDPRATFLQLVRRDCGRLCVHIAVKHAARVEERGLCARWEPHVDHERAGGDLEADVESVSEDGRERFAEDNAVRVRFDGGSEAVEEEVRSFTDLSEAPGGERGLLREFEYGVAFGLGEAAAEVDGGLALDFSVEVVDLAVVVWAEAFDDLDLEEVTLDPVQDDARDEEIAGVMIDDE